LTKLLTFVAAAAIQLLVSTSVLAGDRYALIVTGAAGGRQYAERYAAWRTAFVATLQNRFDYPADRIILLTDDEAPGVRRATRDNVRAALASIRSRAGKDDIVLVLLIGHGTALDSDEGKFNLVGPDLTGEEWAALVRPISGRVIFVNTASGSFPFLHRLAGPGRIVLTANESAAQQFDTVFPDFFVKAFDDDAADTDKNGKTSIWEAFAYASARVKAWFEERGQLVTETALLDDTGRGVGRVADAEGPDGTLAQATYLQPDVIIPANADSELAGLLKKRAEIESAIERLRAGKPATPSAAYEAELEKLLLGLAQIDRQLRGR
jgi:hypothetical protein